VDIHEDESLKYTVQNLLKNNLDTSRYCRGSKAGGIAALLMQNTHLIEIMLKIRCRYRKLNHSQPDNGEQALEIAENLIRSGAIDTL
jgi:recombination protein RecA